MTDSEEPIFLYGSIMAHREYNKNRFPKQPFSSPNRAAYILYYRLPDPPSNWYLPITSLDVPNIVKVLQKMNPVSFTRLRKSCRAMDQIAERHRRHIGIQLWRINIDPGHLFYYLTWTLDYRPRTVYQRRNVENKLASSDEMLFEISPTFKPNYTFRMKLSEASRRLSGFTFEKVIVGKDFGKNQSSLSLMNPQVLEEYMNFVRTQCWRTNAVLMNHTPMEIRKIFKPKMVNTSHLQAFPTSERFPDGLRIYYSWTNITVVHIAVPLKSFEFIGRIAKVFYADQLFVSYIQVKRISIRESTLIEYLNRTQLSERRAAEAFLLHYLENTPFSGSVTQSFYGEVDKFCFRCASKTKWISTSNAILTSRTGRKGLVAVRLETKHYNYVSYEVSIYFWKDQLDFLMPTKEYLEKHSDEINVPRLQAYKDGGCMYCTGDILNEKFW